MQVVLRAASRACAKTGNRIAASIAIMAITTSNSISVKALLRISALLSDNQLTRLSLSKSHRPGLKPSGNLDPGAAPENPCLAASSGVLTSSGDRRLSGAAEPPPGFSADGGLASRPGYVGLLFTPR